MDQVNNNQTRVQEFNQANAAPASSASLRVVDGNALALDVKSGERIVIKTKQGAHYRVLKKPEDKGVLADDVVAKRVDDDLQLFYADNTHVVLQSFFTTCAEESQCSLMLPSLSSNGLPEVITASSAAQSTGAEGVLFSHGQTQSLQQMASSGAGLNASSFSAVSSGDQASELAIDAGVGSSIFSSDVLMPVAGVAALLLVLGALGSSGGGGGGGGGVALQTQVQGALALGPTQAGHGLKATFYSKEGTVLATDVVIADNGTFSATITGYSGPVLVVVRDSNAAADYVDEVAGSKDLNTDLRAMFSVSGSGSVSVSVTPLTELATRILLNDAGGDGNAASILGATMTSAEITAINQAVSTAFGVTSVLGSVTTVLTQGYNDAIPSDQQKYAQALAKLSGLDARTGSVSATLAALKAQFSGGVLNALGQQMLLDGAAIFESGPNASYANLQAALVELKAPSSSNTSAAATALASGEFADHIVTSTEAADGVVLSVAVATNAVAGNTVSLSILGSGKGSTQTTSAYTLTATDVTRGWANVGISQALLNASGEGSGKTVTATFNNGGSTYTRVSETFTYDPGTTVNGAVVLGPLLNTHGLKVTLYKADGSVLVAESSVSATGGFSATFASTYTGAVLVRVRDTSAGADYTDVVSGNLDLSTDLRAVFNTTGPGTVSVSVTPLTELATRILLNDTGGDGTALTNANSVSTTTVSHVNAAVSTAFGVGDLLGAVSTVLASGYNDSLSSNAEQYARLLAKLEGLDARNGSTLSSVSTTLANLQAQYSAGTLSVAGLQMLVDGAAIFESGSNKALSSLIASNATLSAPSIANTNATTTALASGEFADHIVTSTEAADGVVLSVAVATNAVAGNTVSLSILGSGAGSTQTTSAYTLTAADVTRGWADVGISQALLNASGEGSGKTVTATFNNGANTYARVSETFTYAPTATTVEGTVAVGPLLGTHGLKVTLYKADGSVLVAESAVSATGTFSATFASTYIGAVLVRVRDTSAGADYTDVVSGNLDLSTDLRAVFNTTGPGTVSVSVTPLTELATRILLNDTGGDGTALTNANSVSTTTVSHVNAAVSTAFGVGDLLGAVSTVLASGYNDSLSSNAEQYARLLAKLEGLDARNGSTLSSVSTTLANLQAQYSAGTLSVAGLQMLVDGAAIFESGSNKALSSLIASNATLSAPSVANTNATTTALTSGEFADHIVTSTEAADGVVLSVAVATNAVAGNTVSLSILGSGAGSTQTTSAYTLTAADVTRGWADVGISQALLNASGEGSDKTVTATFNNGANTYDSVSETFTYDITAPAIAWSGFVASDDRINLAESGTPASLLLEGTCQTGVTVWLTIAGIDRTPSVVGTNWSYTLSANDLSNLGQGSKTLVLHAQDSYGNTAQASKDIFIDTTAPSLSINTTGTALVDGTIDLSEKTAGVTIGGTSSADAGQLVTVQWGSTSKTGSVSALGAWSVNFAAGDLPADGNTTLIANVSDASGNVATPVNMSAFINSWLGGSAADAFVFASGSTGSRTITNFSKAQGDNIDLHGMLSGVTVGNEGNYVQLSQSGGDALLKVDVQGLSNFAAPEQSITVTNGWSVGGLNDTLTNLINAGAVIVA